MFRDSESSEEKARILQTLGWVKDPELKKKVLAFGISSNVKLSDIDHIFYSLNNTKDGQDLNWQFLKDNIKFFQDKYPVINLSSILCLCINF
jgi:metal-sulfur cluster biosynthetic enzyme